MNSKKAKALRRALIPSREITGISRGTFLRGLTRYISRVVKRIKHVDSEDPKKFWVEEKESITLDPECPRAKYQLIKRAIA